MTEYAQVTNNVPTLLAVTDAVFIPAANGNLPVRALPVLTEPQRNAISTYTVGKDTTPVPTNKKIVGRELRYERTPNTVKWFDVLADMPLNERKVAMHDQVVDKVTTVLEAGYSHDFGAAFGGVHVLDTQRGKKAEWLDYRNACKERIDAGQGSAVMPVPIRTKAEPPVDLLVRANQGMNAMTGMRTREGNIITHARSKDDAIRAATNHAALDAVDINAGWPA